MSKVDVYEMFFQCMSECWEWAYDRPENAVPYIDGLWTMTGKVIDKMNEEENHTGVSEPF